MTPDAVGCGPADMKRLATVLLVFQGKLPKLIGSPTSY